MTVTMNPFLIRVSCLARRFCLVLGLVIFFAPGSATAHEFTGFVAGEARIFANDALYPGQEDHSASFSVQPAGGGADGHIRLLARRPRRILAGVQSDLRKRPPCRARPDSHPRDGHWHMRLRIVHSLRTRREVSRTDGGEHAADEPRAGRARHAGDDPLLRDPRGSGPHRRPRPIHRSNVMLLCPSCGPIRVRLQKLPDGKKVRTCRKCGNTLDQ